MNLTGIELQIDIVDGYHAGVGLAYAAKDECRFIVRQRGQSGTGAQAARDLRESGG